MPIDYPTGFDPENTFVSLYVTPDGALVAHGSSSAPPEIPEDATELTLEEYDTAMAAQDVANAEYFADQEDARQAAALVHFQVLVLIMPEATARLLTGYTGPWPVIP